MNSLERFYATAERRPVDRPAAWLGMPDPQALPGLFSYYGVKDIHELKMAVGDDFYAVEVPYESETAHAIYAAFDWYKNGEVDAMNRTLTAPGCFHDAEDMEDLVFDWRIRRLILMPQNAGEEWKWRRKAKRCWGFSGLPIFRIPARPLEWRRR